VTLRARSIALLFAAAAGCSRDSPPVPSELLDGSGSRPPPVVLEGVEGPSILTRVRVLRRGSRIERCLDPPSAVAAAVERIGVSGVSVTALGAGGRAVYGCDADAARAMNGTRWCGHAFGRLHAGRLRDPRLSLTCRADETPLAFAWIQPGAAASYLVVAREGYNEVYAVAGRLPVRVVAGDVDLESASAAFSVSEHARDGRRLREYVLEARVSG
jgi:hypothetical protein